MPSPSIAEAERRGVFVLMLMQPLVGLLSPYEAPREQWQLMSV